jgi:hypothetical protein
MKFNKNFHFFSAFLKKTKAKMFLKCIWVMKQILNMIQLKKGNLYKLDIFLKEKMILLKK